MPPPASIAAASGSAEGAAAAAANAPTALGLLNAESWVFLAAFLVTLLVTPAVRSFAISRGVIDRPDSARKRHEYPVAYLGGIAVYLGLVVAVLLSYLVPDPFPGAHRPVPVAVLLGMTAIMVTGLADDVWGLGPRLKVAGQLVAAAALAIDNVGVHVAAGLLRPVALWLDPILGTQNLAFTALPAPWGDLVYWVGTALIAIFVLGGCNSANLLDGLDGLLSGVVAVVALGLLTISVLMAVTMQPAGEGSLALARIVLCVALLGAVLGFLPHNFNPASIFLGDCGSLLLGYTSVVIILMLGEMGQTHLVFAGLIVFSVPIMDTMLAIVRRVLAGTPMHSADDQHIHHQISRALGGVKRAVFAIYGISLAFAILGVALAALVMVTQLRVRVVYAIALVLFGFIGMIAVKAARRQRHLAQVMAAAAAAASAAPRQPQAAGPAPAAPRPRGQVGTQG